MSFWPYDDPQTNRLAASLTDTEAIRIAVNDPQFTARYGFDTADVLWDTVQSTNSNILYLSNSNGVNLQAGTQATAAVVRQTKQRFGYTPGRTLRTSFAVRFGAATNNNIRRAGILDDFNGYAFELKSSGIHVLRRSNASGSTVEESIPQSDWNIDKMDGVGVSGRTLDLSKIQMCCIDFSWYGAGTAAMGIKIGRRIYWVHLFEGGNRLTEPHLGNPNLPFRYENINVGATLSPTDLQAWGLEVALDGYGKPSGYVHSVRNTAIRRVNAGATVPILSIRPKAIHKGKNNISMPLLEKFLVTTQDATTAYDIIYNGTLTAPAWSAVNTESVMEFDQSATAIAGGTRIDAGWLMVAGSSQSTIVDNLLPLAVTSAGVADIITISCTAVAATDCAGSLTWREIH